LAKKGGTFIGVGHIKQHLIPAGIGPQQVTLTEKALPNAGGKGASKEQVSQAFIFPVTKGAAKTPRVSMRVHPVKGIQPPSNSKPQYNRMAGNHAREPNCHLNRIHHEQEVLISVISSRSRNTHQEPSASRNSYS
jgi:hypothetical protein